MVLASSTAGHLGISSLRTSSLLMKRVRQELFQGIAWGTGQVMTQTIERAQTLGLTVYRLPELEDVDDADAWGRAVDAYSTLRI